MQCDETKQLKGEIWRGSIHGTYFCDLVANKTHFHKYQIFTCTAASF